MDLAAVLGLVVAAAGLIITVFTTAYAYIKERKGKLKAQEEYCKEREKAKNAALCTTRLRVVMQAVSTAVVAVEQMGKETTGGILSHVKRDMGIVTALDICIKHGIYNASREELGVLIDNIVGYTKCVNGRNKDSAAELVTSLIMADTNQE